MSTIVYTSELKTYSGEEKYELNGVSISETSLPISFQFFKKVGEDFLEFIPQTAGYTFATQNFNFTPKENQLINQDKFIMKIISLN
jgi:hypothetical protein